MIELYSLVRLKKDDLLHGVTAGCVGTVVDVLGNGDAYIVEFADADGETIMEALFTEYRAEELESVEEDGKNR